MFITEKETIKHNGYFPYVIEENGQLSFLLRNNFGQLILCNN